MILVACRVFGAWFEKAVGKQSGIRGRQSGPLALRADDQEENNLTETNESMVHHVGPYCRTG